MYNAISTTIGVIVAIIGAYYAWSAARAGHEAIKLQRASAEEAARQRRAQIRPRLKISTTGSQVNGDRAAFNYSNSGGASVQTYAAARIGEYIYVFGSAVAEQTSSMSVSGILPEFKILGKTGVADNTWLIMLSKDIDGNWWDLIAGVGIEDPDGHANQILSELSLEKIAIID